MARFTVVLPDSVAEWVKKSAKEENVSQSAFVSNMLTYAMAGISRDIRLMDSEPPICSCVGCHRIIRTKKHNEKYNKCGSCLAGRCAHPVPRVSYRQVR